MANTEQRQNEYDVFIIGGGVNGCGLARDAAGRGFKVGLAEMRDLASGTSSQSTKLIHGGLRYLEQYAFRLVREALREREVLWRIAPHIVHPLRFLLPYHKGLRPAWVLRTGLFLYDRLGGKGELPGTKTVHFDKTFSNVLKAEYKLGFEYSDAQVDDARLVVLNARSAAELGADIMVGTQAVSIEADSKSWRIQLYDHHSGKTREVRAAFIANMGGPWVGEVLHHVLHSEAPAPVRLVQGSHIIVPKIYAHDRAYIFQNPDGRIIFTIPYRQDFTLIGTTDLDYKGDPAKVHISEEETEYLCKAASEYFIKPIEKSEIVSSFSGVRSLYDDGAAQAQKATRDYVLKLTEAEGKPPLLTAYGGKITTYRKLSEDAMIHVESALGKRKPAWTARVALPGGDFPHNEIEGIKEGIAKALPAFDARNVARLAESYGTDALLIFDEGRADLGQDFGCGLYEAEVKWLIEKEWARTAEDILWRRSKLGLYFRAEQKAALAAWLAKNTDFAPLAAAEGGASNL